MEEREIVQYVIVSEGRLLLEKRKDDEERYPGLWAIPTGHVEMEGKVSTLIREVQEETGLVTEQFMFLGTIPYESGDDKSLLHVFAIVRFSGTVKEKTDEGRQLEWFTFDEARQKLDTNSEFHRHSIKVVNMVADLVSSTAYQKMMEKKQ